MKILVGLTHECPTEEHIEVLPVPQYPFEAIDKETQVATPIASPEDLTAWAEDAYEIFRLVDVPFFPKEAAS